MDTLLDKLSTYNILNNILPGIIFAWLINLYFSIDLLSYLKADIIISLFIFYFFGMVISRVGSLIIEPILKVTTFITFTNHGDFTKAEHLDAKISTLSEVNNTYRTFIAVFLIIGIFFIIYPCLGSDIQYYWLKFITNIILLSFFLFSYKKQTKYVVLRVNKALNNK